MLLPIWHDYRPARNSLNRTRYHRWCESQSDWLRRLLTQGHHQRQWNSVDETASSPVTAQNNVVLWSRWPITHEYSPETRNLIWLPVAQCDEKLDFQHKKTGQVINCIWMKNVWRLLQANVCAWSQASLLMVKNRGAEPHTKCTVAFRYFRTKKNTKAHSQP